MTTEQEFRNIANNLVASMVGPNLGGRLVGQSLIGPLMIAHPKLNGSGSDQ
jgi:hypothetical protein